MVEIFETIMNYPLQALALLGLGTPTVYGILKAIKVFFGFCTRKKQKAKEIAQMTKQADIVIEKFGGVDGFVDNVANKVFDIMISSFDDLKKQLKDLSEKENCPIEIKAYIETVLSQKGNEELKLLYNQLKNEFISTAKNTTQTAVSEKTEQVIEVEQKTQNAEQNISKNEQIVQESEQNTSKSKNNVTESNDDGDISYA